MAVNIFDASKNEYVQNNYKAPDNTMGLAVENELQQQLGRLDKQN